MNEKKNGNYYSRLTGFSRAVPIILSAVAVFVAVCFLAGDTGILGNGIGAVLLGLFSVGAYSIPLLLITHAIFYAEDVAKSRRMSRAIFSAVTVIVISAIEYTIKFWGQTPVFDPITFFTEKTAGGFIGSTIAFALINVLGSVGLIILAAAVMAIYIAFFFAGKNSALGRVLLAFLEALMNLLALIERGVKKCIHTAKTAKETRARRELEKRDRELLDDQFFDVDDGLRELTISELGIKTSKSHSDIEENPTLQGQVFHKSAVSEAQPPESEKKTEEMPLADGHKRTPVFDYGELHASDLSFAADTPFISREEKPKAKENEVFYGIDEDAEKVFTKNFDPYNFELNEKVAARQSTRATSEGIEEVAKPLNLMTDEEIDKEKRRQEFEAKKRDLLMRAKRDDEALSARPVPQSAAAEAEMPKVEPEKTEASEPAVYSYSATGKTVEFKVTNEPKRVPAEPVTTQTVKHTFEKPEVKDLDPERAADRIADIIAASNPAYTRSFNESKTYTTVSGSTPVISDTSSGSPVMAEEIERVVSEAENVCEDEVFRPYESPAFELTEEAPAKAEELKIERTMLSPSPSSAQIITPRDERYTVIKEDIPPYEEESENEEDEPCDEGLIWADDEIQAEPASPVNETQNDGEGTFFTFGDDEDDSEDEDEGEIENYDDFPEDEAIITDEIPPEKQNPDVIEKRKLFPFLDAEESEDDEEDEPPFELATPAPTPLPRVTPAQKAVPTQSVSVVPASNKEGEKKKPDYSSYEFPPIDILGLDEIGVDENIQEEIQENADKLIETLASFNVTASIKGVDRGPRITRYEVVPAKGVKVSSVMNLQDDIALGLAADGIRMEAPIPGKSAIGVEIPNKRSNNVRLRELLETDDFKSMKSKTAVCIGKDVAGQPVIADLAKMPHLLIAGATGMGKSVCINSLMISMLYKAKPDEVKFIMIDPKQVEFTMYNGIPHLLVPVVSDAKQAAGALMWAVEEMERRYNRLNPLCVRNVEAYNEKVAENPALGEPMSRIIIVIDEFADLMLQVRDPVENLVMRIAQKARAAGIHLIIGTQRPAVNVITGTIKANVPSRISCKVASNVDSRTVLDASGAEKLLNKGDMLFSFAGSIKPLRVQGAFVADREVEEIMAHLKQFSDGNNYDSSVMEEIDRAAQKCSKKGGGASSDDDGDSGDSSGEGYLNDRQFLDAVELAVNTGKISTSLIQRKISVGYGKAAKFIDIMEDMGIVGEPNGQRPRDVLISADEWREKLARTMID